MTNEEATEILKNAAWLGTNKDREKTEEAVNMAIKALRSVLPTGNETEIVYCRDCKYAHITYRGEVKYCDVWFPDESHYMDTDNFCSFAERREEGGK